MNVKKIILFLKVSTVGVIIYLASNPESANSQSLQKPITSAKSEASVSSLNVFIQQVLETNPSQLIGCLLHKWQPFEVPQRTCLLKHHHLAVGSLR